MPFVRGSNPIWYEVDLTAHAFDDTFFLFVLKNTIPYIPADVWHDPLGNVPWTQPIRFLANGTLPVDIYFDPDEDYRLEFRQGDTQFDPLIYLVENYQAAGGGSTPTGSSIVTDNQITNPQFANFDIPNPYILTNVTDPDPITIGPGWVLNLEGTGNLTITREPLNNDPATTTETNAPYALHIVTSGDWTHVFLAQRFQQNGMLWANKTVSSSITAKAVAALPVPIAGILVNSNGTTIATGLPSTNVSTSFNAYPGLFKLLATTNPDVPPAAYIEYQLTIPNDVNIFLTSFQLVVSDSAIEYKYIQDSVDRQIDHTWHTYKDSVVVQPKDSLLTGWDFGLNPWQFTSTTSATLTNQCSYTADQTIVYQQAGANEVAAGQGTPAENLALEIKAIGNNTRFAVIQYMAPQTLADVWGSVVSSLVKAHISSPTHLSEVRFKMRLIWRTTLPSTIGAAEPIASWSGSQDPVFSSGWTAISPINDPIYTFGTVSESFVFEDMLLPAASTDTMTLGIVIYTLDGIIETATADRVLFERVSLVPNRFALDSNILTFDQTLRRCFYYFESSKEPGLLLTDSSTLGAQQRTMKAAANTINPTYLITLAFGLNYLVEKCIVPTTNLYTEGGTIDEVTGYIFRGVSGQIATGTLSVTSLWDMVKKGTKGLQFTAKTSSLYLSTASAATLFEDAFISFFYGADARLGQ